MVFLAYWTPELSHAVHDCVPFIHLCGHKATWKLWLIAAAQHCRSIAWHSKGQERTKIQTRKYGGFYCSCPTINTELSHCDFTVGGCRHITACFSGRLESTLSLSPDGASEALKWTDLDFCLHSCIQFWWNISCLWSQIYVESPEYFGWTTGDVGSLGSLQNEWEAQLSLLALPFIPPCKEIVFRLHTILDSGIDLEKPPIW